MRRNWIKLYVDQCLRGTMISELSAVQRWIWVGLLLMAGDSSEEGLIFLRKDENGAYVGYSDSTIAELLGVEVEDFLNATAKMIRYEKISVDKNKVIKILNWKKYQSEYQRQKPYRSEGQDFLRKEGDKENSNLSCNQSNAIEEDRELDIDRDLEEDAKILTLLSKVKNYPLNKEKDLEFIKGLKAEFPDVDILEKIKQITINWLKFPLLKKSRPRVQIRRWVTNEQKWQKEGQREKKVGVSSHAPSKEEDNYSKARAVKMKELHEKYQTEIDKAMKTKSRDWMDEIDNKIKEEIAEFSREYHNKEEK